MKILLIANPSSGGSEADTVASIEGILTDSGDVRRLAPSLEGFDLEVTQAARDREVVVVAGGDGTFSRVVNALETRLDELVFALVPTGTGNDLARTLHLPEDPSEAARIATGGTERSIDVGRATGAGVQGLFVNACLGGFPVAMNQAVDQDMKSRLGPLAFWVSGAKVAANLPRSTVTLNGAEVTDCVAVGVGNGKTSGGGVRLWPQAAIDDGIFDACALPAADAAAAARLALKVKGGTHAELDDVEVTTGPRIEVDSDPPIEMNVDGELIGITTPVTFELAGRATIKVPTASLRK
ncbi:MAG: YegS/Rv2252/BmrU family lipid kinase [Actinomycetota bacterium]|nr:YegS/Rv2252/BmrU family lipid kinase [Actinomycetota bacterium]